MIFFKNRNNREIRGFKKEKTENNDVKKLLNKIKNIDYFSPFIGNSLDKLLFRYAQNLNKRLDLHEIEEKVKLFKDFKPLYGINNIENYSITDFFVKWFCMSYISQGYAKEYTLFKLLILLKLLNYVPGDSELTLIFEEFNDLILNGIFDNLKPFKLYEKDQTIFDNLLKFYQFPYKEKISYTTPGVSLDNRIVNNPGEFGNDQYLDNSIPISEAETQYSTTDDLLVKWFAETIINKGYPPEIALYELLKHLKNLNFTSFSDGSILSSIFDEFKTEILEKQTLSLNDNKVELETSDLDNFKQLLNDFEFPYTDLLNFNNITSTALTIVPGIPSSANHNDISIKHNNSTPQLSGSGNLDKAVWVATLAKNAGFDRESAIIATAITFPESEGNPNAVGDVKLETNTWGPSLGLWQIRTIKDGSDHYRDPNLLSDPSFQAEAAYHISNQGTNFKPWSTYKSGAYQKYIDVATQAVNKVY